MTTPGPTWRVIWKASVAALESGRMWFVVQLLIAVTAVVAFAIGGLWWGLIPAGIVVVGCISWILEDVKKSRKTAADRRLDGSDS